MTNHTKTNWTHVMTGTPVVATYEAELAETVKTMTAYLEAGNKFYPQDVVDENIAAAERRLAEAKLGKRKVLTKHKTEAAAYKKLAQGFNDRFTDLRVEEV